ncbi:OmpA family protein [Rhodovulum kholense]|uniref:Outer membrane protein OmpA-like peptidoglycan-associated protein n=1 Tax=Rhodovulum kholense TaxID=453584 RepID=A0A8E2VIB9_9RHOB|nr:OmpA family protein [Rhodovulum kholense]PTW46117.1 outer membrane protein OmpA-like peptidoglycan-associated protein [Rhodovulum kholense]
MIRASKPILLTIAGALALGACTDPSVQTGDARQRTKEGAAIGAGLGAVTGLIASNRGGNDAKSALIGAAVGAAAGAAIGNNLDKQAAELRQSFDNNQIGVVNTGNALIVTMPQDILFDTDSAAVRSGLRADLQTLAYSLNDYPNTTVDVIGHTDNTGSASYNQQLSTRRATAVASILTGAGVNSGRIRAYGRGEEQPIASNLSPEGRAQNRRVEIVIRPMS